MASVPGEDPFTKLRKLLFASFSFDEFLSMHVIPDSWLSGPYQKIREEDYEGARNGLEADEEPAKEIDPAYWLLLARAKQGLGDDEDAIEDVKRILDLDIESRFAIQAWTILRELGYMPRGDEGAEVLGVIVEIGRPDGEAIIAGFADGEARMFWSGGGGLVGEQTDEEISAAANALVDEAAGYVDSVEVTGETNRVERGRITFSIITASGIRAHTEGLEDVANEENEFHRLFTGMNMLLTALRLKYTGSAKR